MKTLLTVLAVAGAFVSLNASAHPAIGPSIASGPTQDARVIYKPKPETKTQQPLMAAPVLLKQQGTHPSINSVSPVQRHRGPVGSLTVTVDIQARPAF